MNKLDFLIQKLEKQGINNFNQGQNDLFVESIKPVLEELRLNLNLEYQIKNR